MKLRILSDLHLVGHNNCTHLRPVNKTKRLINSNNDKAECIYTLIAGDISSNRNIRKQFFEMHPNMQGAFVEGNHIVYCKDNKSLREHIQDLRDDYSESSMKFLENNYTEIEDYIVIGSTLWTDFNLTGHQGWAIMNARRTMNDYTWGLWEYDEHNDSDYIPLTADGKLRGLLPKDIVALNNESFNYIVDTVEKFKDRKIIILTHHCPSEQCCDERYRGNITNAYYASNYERFIEMNPQIKLWVCGHCHSKKDFMMYDTRIIMNPIGYKCEKCSRQEDWNKIIEI